MQVVHQYLMNRINVLYAIKHLELVLLFFLGKPPILYVIVFTSEIKIFILNIVLAATSILIAFLVIRKAPPSSQQKTILTLLELVRLFIITFITISYPYGWIALLTVFNIE